ncbi:sigma-70 family RNA polymerase sigma factor, partial [Streptomyces sp. F8]|uniref:RNA polymerase sigma factor n=1 Tax=Streptomyces sp. F8 TaxID=1436085 RepID=UPI0029D0E10C
MGLKDADHADLVVAAQAGDERAREELIAAYLPLLYNIVGRALGGHADVDDVVQETLLRVVRDLPDLRAPESFRSWLVAITLRQINTHWLRHHALADRTTGIDEARRIPDAGAEPVDVTILRLHVSDERRRVVEAGRWLDPDHRMLLALWWQECAGLLSREDMAAAMGLTVAHVGVRLQRMREQLELCRTIVASLEADPRCPQLDETVVGWDGRHASVWRKRIARHTRDCRVCGATSAERVPAELLPLSLTTLAVPAALIAALAAKGLLSGTAASAAGLAAAPVAVGTATATASGGGGLHGALIGKLQAVTAHPLMSLATGAVLVAGTVTYATWPEPAPRVPGATAAPTATAPTPLPSRTTTSAG